MKYCITCLININSHETICKISALFYIKWNSTNIFELEIYPKRFWYHFMEGFNYNSNYVLLNWYFWDEIHPVEKLKLQSMHMIKKYHFYLSLKKSSQLFLL